MSTTTGKIQYITDENNGIVLPVTHERGVVDSSGVNLETKLAAKQATISTVNVSVDNNTGTPSGTASVSGNTLSLSFSNLKGATGATGATGPTGPQGPVGPQGNTGSSVSYPYELINNLTTDDATKGLSAAQGVTLKGQIDQLGLEIHGATHSFEITKETVKSYGRIELDTPLKAGMVITSYTFSPASNHIWLGDTAVRVNLETVTFPYTLTQDYPAIFGGANGTTTIYGNDGSGLPDGGGIIGDIEDINDKLDKLDEDVNGNETIYSHTYSQESAYSEWVEFDSPLPIGTRINAIHVAGNSHLWLTNSSGTVVKEITGETLPFVTVAEYYGMKYSVLSGTASIVYSSEEAKDGVRKCIRVHSYDSQATVFQKMYDAFINGKCDVYFDKATYTLDTVYDTMRTLLPSWAVGLPIGNDNRYFFNGSTIISNPSPTDSWSESRNVLDCQISSQNFEVYDVILINNGGRYCVHDEGNGGTVPYCHKYENVQMFYNVTSTTPGVGSKPFGAGVGYNSTLIFQNCLFEHSTGAETFAVHGINTSNPDPCTFRLIMSNTYIKSRSIYYNLFDPTRDTVEFFLANNCFGASFDGTNTTKLVEFGTVIQSQ